MVNETEKKGKGWLKGILSNSPSSENTLKDEKEHNTEDVLVASSQIEDEFEQTLAEGNKQFFAKENQDKIALDVIVSIESILKDRQLLTFKNKGLEEQLTAANEMINRIKQDQIKQEVIMQEKNTEIRELENNLTNRQMSYDQLLEDYKQYQLTSNMEYEKISNQLDTEIAKYNMFYDESSNTQYQSILKINALEEKIRSLEIENQKYSEQYQKIVNEKTELIKSINDFTEKMSFSFTSKTFGPNTTPSE